MTSDERNMLNDLAGKIAQTPAPPRDPEAEELIRTKIGSRPDALYLMTQTVLIQNLALQRAQQQIQELQAAAGQNQVASGSSFLGSGSGGRSPGYTQAGYAPGGGQPYASPAPQYAPAPSSGGGGGGSSFLRGAAQTAAGVAAGSLAAEAIGSMFGHSGGGFGGGSGFLGGSGGVGAPSEEIVNNYYDSPSGDDRGRQQGNDFVDPGDMNASDDSGQSDDNSQFDDSTIDSGDDGSFDDNSGDNFA